MTNTNEKQIEQIAKTAHEINKVYCEFLNDYSQKSWKFAPQWQKDSAINGVNYHLNNENTKPSDSHESWLEEKKKNGWVFGKLKDEIKKTHPCIIPYSLLSKEQQFKNTLFLTIVQSFK